MTNQEAEKELERLKKIWIPPFCPLINGKCRMDCVAFSEYEIFGIKDGSYFVGGGFCVNKMLVE